ncbi:hypothetical protein [endosymbiont of Ridgeia piscesae]|jgi:hypothetical protein|uniref:hypothetical protein n=1 Tax=endosymbiont of Ridgeia piscesae TaxID=54398 RepID=UPI0012F9C95C|nr:hypothetical protein [endosymbiont of Ridgeia piscesae]
MNSAGGAQLGHVSGAGLGDAIGVVVHGAPAQWVHGYGAAAGLDSATECRSSWMRSY